MPDISMCDVNDCPLSKRCYRHEDSGTKPVNNQLYVYFADGRRGEDCDMFKERTAEAGL